MRRCAAARSRRAIRSCSKAWAAASPGARCCSTSEAAPFLTPDPIPAQAMKPFAFVFPGQGSQAVGMLDAWGDHPAVAGALKEASDALGEDIAALIKEG